MSPDVVLADTSQMAMATSLPIRDDGISPRGLD